MAEAAVINTLERYISADDIPVLTDAREQVRQDAWTLVRQRQQQLANGEEIQVPLAIDALSTAEAVLEAEATDLHQERLAGLQLDCQRLVAEWFRKNKPEYFPPSRHFFNAETGDFFSHGLSIRQMTENALRPINNDAEEVERRVNERVENETPLLIKKLGGFALEQVGIRTISECTNKAIGDYQHDINAGNPHKGYGGYVPEIEKVMIRDIKFDGSNGDRLEEQIGLPGIYINHFVIQESLRRRGVETKHMGKTELHGTQLLVSDDLIEFVALLDEVASTEWCTNIFLGEEVPGDYKKVYSNVRSEALARQAQLKDTADTVTNYVLDLARDKVDKHRAPQMIENFVKKLLLDMAKNDNSLAIQMFDENTAHSLRKVAFLESIGLRQEAFELMDKVESMAPGGGYCSGGSCGLESVNLWSDEGRDLFKKLKAEPGDRIVKDKERKCKCGSKDIIYAYNSKKVNKYCSSCQAFESKETTVNKSNE